MYFTRYDPLKKSLRERTLSDREALPYYVLLCAILALATSLPLTTTFKLWEAVDCLISIAVAILGTLYCCRTEDLLVTILSRSPLSWAGSLGLGCFSFFSRRGS